MRTIFVGDIHGCLDEFQELIKWLSPDPSDAIFCAGDFMDRGPDPVGCVRFARTSGFFSVLGNHEESHLRWRRHEDRRAADPSYKNPMQPMTAERQAQNAALTAEDIAWLRSLPLTVEPLPGWILVHAGLFPGKTIEEQVKDKELRDKIIRLRWVDQDGDFVPLEDDTAPTGPPGSRPWMDVYDGPYNVVYGHAVHSLETPKVNNRSQGVKTYGIDTGCCFGGRLSALVVEGKKVYFEQTKAKKAYATMRYT
jgi:diadenosine tetraphosphatase ApaH/serine/threonine PP2A family protein phosphatase